MNRIVRLVITLAFCIAILAAPVAASERPARGASGRVVAERPSADAGLDFLSGKRGWNPRPCTKHARLMRKACHADMTDDYLVHLADCSYVVSADEEHECRFEAIEEATETLEECADVFEERLALCELLGERRFDIEFDPSEIVDPNEIGQGVSPNPYWPLAEGHTHVILADGEVTVVTATDEVIDVGGLPCRVVRDLVFEEVDEDGEVEYEAVEVTQDWYAQTVSGDILYCGENTYEIEDGLIDNTDGSFANGTDRARAGFLLRAYPEVGRGDRQEMATDEAEDYVRYESLATTPSEEEGGDAKYACSGNCLKTYEVNPRDPGEAEYKYYVRGIGFVLATKLEDGEFTGEREEVSCVGGSLEILDDPSCGISDPEALREALCAWAPEALCEDDEE